MVSGKSLQGLSSEFILKITSELQNSRHTSRNPPKLSIICLQIVEEEKAARGGCLISLAVVFWLGSFKHFILRRCTHSRSLINSFNINLSDISQTLRRARDKTFQPSSCALRCLPFPFALYHILLFSSLHSSGDVNVDRSCNIHSTINLISWHKQTANGFCREQFFFVWKVHIELHERETIRNSLFYERQK